MAITSNKSRNNGRNCLKKISLWKLWKIWANFKRDKVSVISQLYVCVCVIFVENRALPGHLLTTTPAKLSSTSPLKGYQKTENAGKIMRLRITKCIRLLKMDINSIIKLIIWFYVESENKPTSICLKNDARMIAIFVFSQLF